MFGVSRPDAFIEITGQSTTGDFEPTVIEWKRNTITLPVSNDMLMDYGLIPDTRHHPPRFPRFVIWPAWDRAADRVRHAREVGRYMLDCWNERDDRDDD